MTSIAHELAHILPTLRHHGHFYAAGTVETVMPMLEVSGVGRIALPLLPAQAEQLIAVATRAPFGRGQETLTDTDVRKTWQIGADCVHLSGRNWCASLATIVDNVATGLGVSDPVTAELYKLLVYDAGSFFAEHRDTEKIPGMFATLVVVLPCVCSGGELIIRHQDQEVCIDLNRIDPADVSYAAFYADCVHEVRPVTSGFRLTLVYNLVRKGKGPALTLPAYDKEQAHITALLQHWIANKDLPGDDSPEKIIYPLVHAYTSAELAFATLKNADAAAAAVLVAAAEDAACDIHLALLSITESGSAEHTDYERPDRWRRARYDEDEDKNEEEDEEEDDFEIDEVMDRTLTVSDWRLPDGSQPAINALPFTEAELCSPGAFKDLKPDEQYFYEATGNEGASFERTYRRAAFVLWPRSHKLAVLNQAGLRVTLPYLMDLAKHWSESGTGKESPLWSDAHTLSDYMLRDWPTSTDYGYNSRESNATPMLSTLEQLRDTDRIDAFLADISANGHYNGDENDALASSVLLLPPARAADLIEKIITKNAHLRLSACAALLARIAGNTMFADTPALLFPAAAALVETLTNERNYPTQAYQWPRPAPIGSGLIVDLLVALCAINATTLADRVTGHVLAHPASFGMDTVLIPAAVELTDRAQTKEMAPVRRLRAACLTHLRARIAEPLAPPADFTRPSAVACQCKDCDELTRFLADAGRKEWTFKATADRREHIEHIIRDNACDLDFTTVKKSRPYHLICTKNQASYEKRVRQRKSDLGLVIQLAID